MLSYCRLNNCLSVVYKNLNSSTKVQKIFILRKNFFNDFNEKWLEAVNYKIKQILKTATNQNSMTLPQTPKGA